MCRCSGIRLQAIGKDGPSVPAQTLTPERMRKHPNFVRSIIRRIAAALLIVALPSGASGLCAGWVPTPEARMACCMDESNCPMHKSGLADPVTTGISQAEADSCCAMSEGGDSAPSTSGFVPVVTLSPVVGPPFEPPSSVRPPFDVRFGHAPLPGTHVPKHVLLSVFLI
jgi:hypothetical protein